ncbi:unnamed protein product, partial [Meganyctiphanes norvegica]
DQGLDIDRYKEALKAKGEQIKEHLIKIKGLEDLIVEKDNYIENLNDMVINMKKEDLDTKEKCQKALLKLYKMEDELRVKEEELILIKLKMDDNLKEFKQLEDEKGEACKVLAKQDHSLVGLEKVVRDGEEELNRREREMDQKTKELDQKTKELDKKTKELDLKTKELDDLKVKTDALIEDLQFRVDSLEALRVSVNDSMDGTLNELKQVDIENTKLKLDLGNTKDKLANLEIDSKAKQETLQQDYVKLDKIKNDKDKEIHNEKLVNMGLTLERDNLILELKAEK